MRAIAILALVKSGATPCGERAERERQTALDFGRVVLGILAKQLAGGWIDGVHEVEGEYTILRESVRPGDIRAARLDYRDAITERSASSRDRSASS